MSLAIAPALDTSQVQLATANSVRQWVEVAGSRFVPLRILASDPFCGTIRWRDIESTCISEITANAHRVLRTPDMISASDPRHFKVSLQLEGTGIVTQDGRQTMMRPGDITIYDTSRPYSLEFLENMRCVVMAFPQDMFDVPASLIRRITAVRLPGDDGVGALISPFLRHLGESLGAWSGVTGLRILRATLDLLTALVYAQLAEQYDHWGESGRAEMRTFRLYIDTHLGDRQLSATTVAKAHFISVRYLQYLFSEEGMTVSDYIRARRLEHCAIDLSDPAQVELSVQQVALRWGFPDASHFSKVFKRQFDMSPRQFRAAHLEPVGSR